MASAKFLEEALSTDVDESEVNAIVGSLENQLVTSSSSITSHQSTAGAISSQNHMNNVISNGNNNSTLKHGVSNTNNSMLLNENKLNNSNIHNTEVTSISNNVQNSFQTSNAIKVNDAAVKLIYPPNSTNILNNRVTFPTQNGTLTLNPQQTVVQASTIQGKQAIVIKNSGVSGSQSLVTVPMNVTTSLVNSAMGTGAPEIVTISKPINSVSNPTMVAAGSQVQLVNVRQGIPNQNNKATTINAPRVVIGNPNMLTGVRTAQGANITIQSLQQLQPGQQGHLLLKTETGQYHVLRVGPTPTLPPPAAGVQPQYRIQSLPAVSRLTTQFTGPPLTLRKTIVQQGTVASSLPSNIQTSTSIASLVSSASTPVNSISISQPSIPSVVTTTPSLVSTTPVSSSSGGGVTSVTIGGGHIVTTVTTSPVQKPLDNAKEKCRKFLANLLGLSSREPKKVEQSVRTLIQELIDTKVEPEEFCDRLEKLLNASPQPCLIGFLKKSLPPLRQSLLLNEMVIDGIRPPPFNTVFPNAAATQASTITTSTVTTPTAGSGIQVLQQQTIRPGAAAVAQLRVMTGSGPPVSVATGIVPIVGSATGGNVTAIRAVTPGSGAQTPQIITVSNMLQQQRLGQGVTQIIRGAPSSLSTTNIVQQPPKMTPIGGANASIVTTQFLRQPISSSSLSTNASLNNVIVSSSQPPALHVTGSSASQLFPSGTQIRLINSNQSSQLSTSQNSQSSGTVVTIIPSQGGTVTPPTIKTPGAGPGGGGGAINHIQQIRASTPSITTTTTTIKSTITSRSLDRKTSQKSVPSKAALAKAERENKRIQQQMLLLQSNSSQSNKSIINSDISRVTSSISSEPSVYVPDDDINDVAAMGGVNLQEEHQRILGSTALIGTQIRSCKDELFLNLPALQQRLRQHTQAANLEDATGDICALVSHATQELLKNMVEKLSAICAHRMEIYKNDAQYEVTRDIRSQIKFLEELDRAERKRHDEQERELLLRAAKSRSKNEDPEQAKLKAKAKEMQRAEMEELRQREANLTALQAIGPRKKPKLLDGNDESGSQGNSGASGNNPSSSIFKSGTSSSSTGRAPFVPLRPRIKRINQRDILFLMEEERDKRKSLMLYKTYLK